MSEQTMNSIQDCYTLSNGQKLPCIGFGTYKTRDPQQDKAVSIILDAIRAGYRFFDTASIYETESSLGRAIKESGIPREEFFIETKVWIDEMGYESTKKAFEASLRRLQMDYVDLYLIHWPRQTGAIDENWKELDLETWRAMEELYDEGKIRSLGCSNFLPHHLEPLLANARILPVVDQLEIHLGHSQEAAVAYCQAHNILPMSWGPLGRGHDELFTDNKIIQQLSEKYGKSMQQISLHYLLQRDILPIPKASSFEHMQSNLDVFDFTLTEEEIWMLSCIPQTVWLGEHPDLAIPQMQSNPDQV